jgi:hypothetical protein
MLFREIVAVYCENHTKHINTLCGHFSLYLTGNTLLPSHRAQPVNAVWGNSRCRMWEPYGTRKYLHFTKLHAQEPLHSITDTNINIYMTQVYTCYRNTVFYFDTSYSLSSQHVSAPRAIIRWVTNIKFLYFQKTSHSTDPLFFVFYNELLQFCSC